MVVSQQRQRRVPLCSYTNNNSNCALLRTEDAALTEPNMEFVKGLVKRQAKTKWQHLSDSQEIQLAAKIKLILCQSLYWHSTSTVEIGTIAKF